MAKLKRIEKRNLQYRIEDQMHVILAEQNCDPYWIVEEIEKNQLLNAWFCGFLKNVLRNEISSK